MVNMIYAYLGFMSLLSSVSGDYLSFEEVNFSFPNCNGVVVLRSDSDEIIESNIEVFIFLDPFQIIEDFTGSVMLENGVGYFEFRIWCGGSYSLRAQAGFITGYSDWMTVDDDDCYDIDYAIDNGENSDFYANVDFFIIGTFNYCNGCYLNIFEINGDEILGDTYLEITNGNFESTLRIVGPGDKVIMIVINNEYSIILLETVVPGFFKYEFVGGEPTRVNEIFSIKIEVFAENFPDEVSTDGYFEMEIEVYNDLESRRLDDSSSYFSGIMTGTTSNGELIFNNLKFLVPDEYYIYIWNSELDYPEYTTLTIVEGNGVSNVIVSASTNTLKLGQTLSLTVSLFQDEGLFTEETEITLQGSGLGFIGDNKITTVTGIAVFYVSFESLGVTTFTATSSKDYSDVEVESFTVFSVDPLCEVLDDGGDCLECIYLANFKDGLCECIDNSFYDEPYCFCDDGYIDELNGECGLCSDQFSNYDLLSYYNDNYDEIIVFFSENVMNSTQDCESFVVLSDFYKNRFLQCIWLNSKTFVLKFSEQLPAVSIELLIDSSLKPNKELCNIKNDNVYVIVNVVYDLPSPEIQLDYPSFVSIPCLDSNVVVKDVVLNNDYEYNWEAVSLNSNLINSVAGEKTSAIVLDKNLLVEEELIIHVTVRSILYETETSETIIITVTNTPLLTIAFNHGSQISTKASSPLFIKAQVQSSCDISGPYIYNWNYYSDSLIDLDSLVQNSPKTDGVYFPAYTFSANSIYIIEVNVTSNSTDSINSYGVAQIKIDVALDKLKLNINKWGGVIGIDNDLEIIAYAQDTDYADSSISFAWSCGEGSEVCTGNNGDTLYSSTSGDKLTISKDQLRNGAIYLFQVIASTAQKSESLQVEMIIDETIKGYANIPSVEDKVTNRKNVNIISEVKPYGQCSFNWDFEPNLDDDSGIHLEYPFLSIPPNALNEGKTYKITLQMSSEFASDFKVYTYTSRSSVPTCDSFTVEISNNKYYLEGVSCSSPQKYLTYQFGFKNADDKVYWVTSATPISYASVFISNDHKEILMNVCDEYECTLFSNTGDRRLQKRQLAVIDDFLSSITNPDDIPDAVIYYIKESDSRSTFNTIAYTMGDYFYSEIIDGSNIDLFISCLSSILETSDYVNTEITTYFKNLTVSTLERFSLPLSNSQAENLAISFAPFISKLTYEDLHELSSTIRNLWFKDKLPGESILNIEGIFALYGNRVLSSELPGFVFSLTDTIISIPSDLDIDESLIIDISYAKYSLDDDYLDLTFYISGTFIDYSLIFIEPTETQIVSNSSIQVDINGTFDLDRDHECRYYNGEKWENSGCDIVKVTETTVTVHLDHLSSFRITEISNTCDTGRGPVIAMGIIIIALLALAGAFVALDSNIKDSPSIGRFLIIYPYSSLFYRQHSFRRSVLTLQMLGNFLVLFCLIGILELEFNSPENSTTDDYGDYFESSIHAGAAAWAIAQGFILPFFLYNCVSEKNKVGLIIQGIIWLLCSAASIVGIIYMTAAFCSQYTFYWIINILIFTPIQIVLDCLYAFVVKYLCCRNAQDKEVSEKTDKRSRKEEKVLKTESDRERDQDNKI